MRIQKSPPFDMCERYEELAPETIVVARVMLDLICHERFKNLHSSYFVDIDYWLNTSKESNHYKSYSKNKHISRRNAEIEGINC